MDRIGTVHTGPIDIDIAAREAQVVGERQRILPLALDEISEEAKQLLLTLGTSFGDGVREARLAQTLGNNPHIDGDQKHPPIHIPSSIATMLRHPNLYRRQMDLNIELVRGAIPPRERELVVLRVAWLCRAPYEWGEHVEMAKLSGVSTDEIERVTQGSSAEGWSDRDRAVLRAVEELLGDQSVADATWSALAAHWSETQLMELPVLVGVYHTHAMQQNCLRIRRGEYNKGLRHR
jgi:4-carboxymuconolactone decarboxylase